MCVTTLCFTIDLERDSDTEAQELSINFGKPDDSEHFGKQGGFNILNNPGGMCGYST